jgi:hypothetical protein
MEFPPFGHLAAQAVQVGAHLHGPAAVHEPPARRIEKLFATPLEINGFIVLS